MEIINNPKCIGCGSELERVSEEETVSFTDEESQVYEFKCPNCGVYEVAYCPPEEDKQNYPAYNKELDDSLGGCSHGYEGLCPICGSHIIWSGDFMRSEVWGDVEGEEDEYGCLKDDSLAPNVVCPHCGSSIDIIYPKPSEEKNYPFYDQS